MFPLGAMELERRPASILEPRPVWRLALARSICQIVLLRQRQVSVTDWTELGVASLPNAPAAPVSLESGNAPLGPKSTANSLSLFGHFSHYYVTSLSSQSYNSVR